ncbi:unnamed protein product [Parascedosporium putredinis]|uniref:Xrn1 N-terminal domain-containing protein n=1 Tax=Parascedosporium putredinis TaxID=1442378 RepID=A0A9P1M668_9PEZI|nr:unnamed protein product [Parascedosporium putredinis]CAI7989164.1 unnamed protein product [Parascedosporium putredinis]
MNGIVHPCSHPEDRPAPRDEEEMMLEIFKYTDRVVNMVRPRKVLVIAVGMFAPMNQQRSRRFRSAQEAKEKEAAKAELRTLLQQQGSDTAITSSEDAVKKAFDSNSITPGTPFMDILATSLRYWCAYKLNTDAAWANLKVIISDATVPGEGEHKIMDFVRSQRAYLNRNMEGQPTVYGGYVTRDGHIDLGRAQVIMDGLAKQEDAIFKRRKQQEDRHAAFEEPSPTTPNIGSIDTGSRPVPPPLEGPVDTVRLWEEGYADRYYEQKFQASPRDVAFRNKVAQAYVEGLSWVLLYYFQGCPSWDCEIIDFYPEEFEIDLNGKKMAWQGVALLPFIEMPRLLTAVEQRYPLLSPEDADRNKLGKVVLLLSDANSSLYSDITSRVEKLDDYLPHGCLEYPLQRKAMPSLEYDRSLVVGYELSHSAQSHKSMLLRGVEMPKPYLNRGDIETLKGHSTPLDAATEVPR